MNNRIARKLNQCRQTSDPKKAASLIAHEITEAHNAAVSNGFIDIPTLDFIEGIIEDNSISLRLKPKAGIININDLYNLKTLWGADDQNVLICEEGSSIELVFKK